MSLSHRLRSILTRYRRTTPGVLYWFSVNWRKGWS